MSDIVETLDRKFLMLVNGHHAPWLDRLFWAITQTYAWIPFYLLVIYLLCHHYLKTKNSKLERYMT